MRALGARPQPAPCLRPCLAATAAGLISPGAPSHDAVMEYLLPTAVPLLLLGADLHRVVRTTGDLLKAFLIGSGVNLSHTVAVALALVD